MQRTVPNSVRDSAQESVRNAAQTNALSSVGKRFPRESRLLRHADFDRVYREGKRHFSTHMTVFYLPRTEPPASGFRIGLTVSRALGGAVDRNRLRRRMREAVRFTRPTSAPAIDVVINPKRSVLRAEFEIVLAEVARAFETVLRKSSGTGGEK
jgi:ribonuclease P protein component